MRTLALVAVTFGVLLACPAPPAQAQPAKEMPAPAEVRAIARDAYIYGFPLVDNYRVMHSFFVARGGREFKAPWNEIHNEARVYTPDDRTIQTPNSDTPYSQLGTDLRTEPLVITVPPVDKGRYYSLQFIDAYTFNYAYVGSRATGREAGNFLLAGPGWKGEKPAGVKAVIRSETEIGWIQYRTQLLNPDDVENVKKVQAGYTVQPLSAFLGRSAPPAAPSIDFVKPLTPEQQRTSPKFFEVLNFMLQFCPIHPSEKELMARFARLGIGPKGGFEAAKLSPELRQAVEAGMADAWKRFDEFKKTQLDTGRRTAAEGSGTRAFLKNDYLVRMSSAVLGIYGNSKEKALYPAYYVDSAGQKLDGSKNRYTLRFAPAALPRSMRSGRSRCTSCRPACSSPIRSSATSSIRRCFPASSGTRTADSRCAFRTRHPARTTSRTGCRRRRARSGWCCGCTGPRRALLPASGNRPRSGRSVLPRPHPCP